jgi:hypothetical protein
VSVLDILGPWMANEVFAPSRSHLDAGDSHVDRRAAGVERIARALHKVALATVGQTYQYVRFEEVMTPHSSVASHLFPKMVGATTNVARQIVTLEIPFTGRTTMLHDHLFGSRGHYGLNAVALDRQVGADGRSRAQVCLHLSNREFVPYMEVNDTSTGESGLAYVWATVTTDGVMRFERVTCDISARCLLEASLGRRPAHDALTIKREELDGEEIYPGFAYRLGDDLPLLAAYLRELAQFLTDK